MYHNIMLQYYIVVVSQFKNKSEQHA